MTRLRPWATLVFTGVLLASCATTTVRRHPEFAARRAAIRSVAVMPPTVILRRIVFKGDDERLASDEQRAQRALFTVLAEGLALRGIAVKPVRLEDEDMAQDGDLRYQTTLMQAKFEAAGLAMQPFVPMRASNADRVRLSLGPDVGRFTDRAGADALVFAQLVGFTKSGGQIARDVAVSVLTMGNVVYATGLTGLQVALVDGTTGEVLWSNSALIKAFAPDGPRLQTLVSDVLGQFSAIESR